MLRRCCPANTPLRRCYDVAPYALPRRHPLPPRPVALSRIGHRQHARHHTADAARPIVYIARWVWGGVRSWIPEGLCLRARASACAVYKSLRRTASASSALALVRCAAGDSPVGGADYLAAASRRVKRLRGDPEVERTEEHEGVGESMYFLAMDPRCDVPEGGLAKSPAELDAEKISVCDHRGHCQALGIVQGAAGPLTMLYVESILSCYSRLVFYITLHYVLIFSLPTFTSCRLSLHFTA
ncbi:hypothetical protein C8R44DRAFT_864528 [Mycena epipterygia]|nr:hypothetical protein C8R44DRAFT_864528 [Mycena epipterygia]